LREEQAEATIPVCANGEPDVYQPNGAISVEARSHIRLDCFISECASTFCLHAFALTKHEAGGVCGRGSKGLAQTLPGLDERLTPEVEGGMVCGMPLKRGKRYLPNC